MRLRILSLFLLVFVGTSCEFFNLKKKSQLQQVDTIIDFSSVDVSPSFKACDSLIEKIERTNCFRSSIHKYISESLSKHKLEVKKSINEKVIVEILISNTGKVIISKIHSSDFVKKMLPNLDSLLNSSIEELPKLRPARTKKGIPLTTQYQIPIQIRVN